MVGLTRAIASQPEIARFDLRKVEATHRKQTIEAFAPAVPNLNDQMMSLTMSRPTNKIRAIIVCDPDLGRN